MLYFGYTFCPDVCPLTLQNVGDVLQKMGADAQAVRVLFVTVDPKRDSLPVLGHYLGLFGPRFVGLRGTPDQLATLARRYRIAYSVTPAAGGKGEEVTHSSAGAARLLVPSLASSTPDIEGVAADLTRLAREHSSVPGWLERLV
jgi:protein SCO1/2